MALGISLDYFQARTSSEFDTAFDTITKEKVNGLLVFPEAATLANRLESSIRFQAPSSQHVWLERICRSRGLDGVRAQPR